MNKNRKPLSVFLNALIALFFMVCVALLLYPYISNHIMYARQYEKIVSYDNRSTKMNEETRQSYLSAANVYNKKILEDKPGYVLSEEQLREYNSLLSFDSDNAMGYIRIPKIDVNLLIYHTVDDIYLSQGTGHLPGSSLPVGGKGTNAVIMGHSGLTSATLFTNLDRLEIGDKFFICVLGDTLAYEVDDKSVVEPGMLNDISISPDKDICTLITCTPYGVNSHRLIVTGHRVPYSEETGLDTGGLSYYKIRVPDTGGLPDLSEILAMLGIAVLLSGIIILIVKKKKHRHKEHQMSGGNNNEKNN